MHFIKSSNQYSRLFWPRTLHYTLVGVNMKKLKLLIVSSFFITLCFTPNSNAFNPCNTGFDCSNQKAEELIERIASNARTLRAIFNGIKAANSQNVTVTLSQRELLKFKANTIHADSEDIYRRFAAILEAQNIPDAGLIAKRYSGQLWRAYEASYSSKNAITNTRYR